MSCPNSINAAIDAAIQVLEDLRTMLAAGTPPWMGWHINTIDGTTAYYRTNQINTDDGGGTAITFKVDPSTQPESVNSVEIEFSPY